MKIKELYIEDRLEDLNIKIPINNNGSFLDIHIAQGTSFGSNHTTTNLAIEAIIKNIKNIDLNSYSLDLGSGSGILSILLSKIGFNSVHSCEIDDFAKKESLINLKKNLVEDNIKFVDFPSNLKIKYGLIVSNISGKYLEKNFSYIINKLEEKGIFIISGLNKSKKESFTNLASIENIKILDVLVSGSWMAMIFKK
jgi:ribosomal protein L11 methyltransferase